MGLDDSTRPDSRAFQVHYGVTSTHPKATHKCPNLVFEQQLSQAVLHHQYFIELLKSAFLGCDVILSLLGLILILYLHLHKPAFFSPLPCTCLFLPLTSKAKNLIGINFAPHYLYKPSSRPPTPHPHQHIHQIFPNIAKHLGIDQTLNPHHPIG